LYGEGPAKAALIKKIKNNGLSQILSINGSTKNIYEAMRDFDIFLLTSKYEGLPNVLIEAQLLGIPVVATNAGGSAETFIPGETGFIITHRRPADIASQINFLINDIDRYTKFSIKAAIYAEKRFDIRFIGKQYTELFNTI
jgi:glycosyltransferase involved in cell wall biosynthesis